MAEWKTHGRYRFRADERFADVASGFRQAARRVLENVEVEWDQRWRPSYTAPIRALLMVGGISVLGADALGGLAVGLGVVAAAGIELWQWSRAHKREAKIRVAVDSEGVDVTKHGTTKRYPREHTRFVVRRVQQSKGTTHQVVMVRVAGLREEVVLAENATKDDAEWLATTLDSA